MHIYRPTSLSLKLLILIALASLQNHFFPKRRFSVFNIWSDRSNPTPNWHTHIYIKLCQLRWEGQAFLFFTNLSPSYPESTTIGKTVGCSRNLSPLKVICIFPCGLIYATKVDVLIMPHFMLEFALDKLAAPRGGHVLLRSEPRRLKSALPPLPSPPSDELRWKVRVPVLMRKAAAPLTWWTELQSLITKTYVAKEKKISQFHLLRICSCPNCSWMSTLVRKKKKVQQRLNVKKLLPLIRICGVSHIFGAPN